MHLMYEFSTKMMMNRLMDKTMDKIMLNLKFIHSDHSHYAGWQ